MKQKIGIAASTSLVLTLMIAASQARAEPNSAEILTFDQALAKAQENSIKLKRSSLSLEKDKASRKLVDLGSEPKLSLGATLSEQRPKPEPSRAALMRNQTYSVELSQTLLDFGRTSSKRDAADYAARVDELALGETSDELFWEVAQAYLGVVKAKRIVTITEEQLDISKSRFAAQEKDYKLGLRPESDWVSAQADLGRATIALARAEDDLRLARLALSRVLDPNATSTSPVFAVPKEILHLPSPKKAVEMASQWTTSESATAKKIKAQIEALSADRAAISAGNRPTVTGQLGYQYSGSWSKLRGQTTATLGVNWDVPWNGKDRIELARVAIDEASLHLALKDEETGRAGAIDQAREQLSSAARLWKLTKAQLELYKRREALAFDRYQSGKASALELSNAESDLIAAKLDAVNLVNRSADSLLAIAKAHSIKDLKGVLK